MADYEWKVLLRYRPSREISVRFQTKNDTDDSLFPELRLVPELENWVLPNLSNPISHLAQHFARFLLFEFSKCPFGIVDYIVFEPSLKHFFGFR